MTFICDVIDWKDETEKRTDIRCCHSMHDLHKCIKRVSKPIGHRNSNLDRILIITLFQSINIWYTYLIQFVRPIDTALRARYCRQSTAFGIGLTKTQQIGNYLSIKETILNLSIRTTKTEFLCVCNSIFKWCQSMF